MTIRFRLLDNNEITILRDGKDIGQIIRSGRESIQICGFDEIGGGPWGCGIYDNKKDIQLRFKKKCDCRSDVVGKTINGSLVLKCSKCGVYLIN